MKNLKVSLAAFLVAAALSPLASAACCGGGAPVKEEAKDKSDAKPACCSAQCAEKGPCCSMGKKADCPAQPESSESAK